MSFRPVSTRRPRMARHAKADPVRSMSARAAHVNRPKHLISIFLDRRVEGHQVLTQGVNGELGPSLRPRLAHRLRYVGLHSPRGKPELLRDCLIAEAVDYETDNFEFAFGQAIVPARHERNLRRNADAVKSRKVMKSALRKGDPSGSRPNSRRGQPSSQLGEVLAPDPVPRRRNERATNEHGHQLARGCGNATLARLLQ